MKRKPASQLDARRFIYAPASHDKKTGCVGAVYLDRGTCPLRCPMRGTAECYGECGNCRLHWDRLGRGGGLSWDEFRAKLKRERPVQGLLRLQVLGDLPTLPDGTIDLAYLEQVALILASYSAVAWCYTHIDLIGSDWVAKRNREIVKKYNKDGRIVINFSADTMQEADQAAALGLPVAVVLESGTVRSQRTPEHRTIAVCPNSQRASVQCDRCKLCLRADRQALIGLPAHGPAKNKINARLAANF